MQQTSYHSYHIMALVATAFALCLTILPAESRWAEADVIVARWLPTGCILGIIGLMTLCQRIRYSTIDALVLTWIIYYTLRIFMGAEYACATQVLKYMSACLLYFSLRGLYSIQKISPLWLLAGILLCACYEAAAGLIQIFNGSSRHYLYPMTGSFLNPGPYSAYLMIGGIASWEAARCCRQKTLSGILPYISTIFICLILITHSRAALIGLAIYAVLTHRRLLTKHKWWTLAGGMVAIALLYWVKKGSADGRLLIWWGALMSWSDSPWFGCGIGGFAKACGDGIAAIYHIHPHSSLWSSAGVAEYAFNDPLLLLVEQGVVGLALGTLTIGFTLYSLKKCHIALFWIAAMLCVFSLFSYPFEMHSYRIIMITMAAWSATYAPCINAKSIWGIAILVIFVPLGWWLRHNIEERNEADRRASLLISMHHAAYLDDYYRYYPMQLDNPPFLFAFGKVLREEGRFQDSNAILMTGTKVSADPMFKIVIGNNYRDMGLFHLAEKSYHDAYAMMPNRIYPLYKLMLLYNLSGDTAHRRHTARRILAAKPKVDSPAVREMVDSATIYAK